MVTVVIMGTAAALAGPSLGRESAAARGKAYAEEVTQELQRARMEAVSSRQPRYVLIYSDRVETRSSAGTSEPPLHMARARAGVAGLDVSSTALTPTAKLATNVAKQVVFTTMGSGYVGSTAPVNPTPVYVYISNDGVAASHPDRQLRVDVAALTGQVLLRRGW